jgi:hypothetical protein
LPLYLSFSFRFSFVHTPGSKPTAEILTTHLSKELYEKNILGSEK